MKVVRPRSIESEVHLIETLKIQRIACRQDPVSREIIPNLQYCAIYQVMLEWWMIMLRYLKSVKLLQYTTWQSSMRTTTTKVVEGAIRKTTRI